MCKSIRRYKSEKNFPAFDIVPDFDESPQRIVPVRKIPIPDQFPFSQNKDDQKMILPTYKRDGSVPRISADTMVDVLNGEYDDDFDELYVIDCRFDYEYDGGHIPNAVNLNSPNSFQELFFDEPIKKAIIVFHCEFSHNRGPQLAALFRDADRELNKETYPQLFYPDVYVLDGGYKEFYEHFPEYCDGGYTRMLDDEYRSNGTLAKATSEFRHEVDKLLKMRRKSMYTNIPQMIQNGCASPKVLGFQSPVASKSLRFVSSPMASLKIA